MKRIALILLVIASMLSASVAATKSVSQEALASGIGIYAEIYNLSQFKVFIQVPNHPELNGELAPFDNNTKKVSVYPLNLSNKMEYCKNGRAGFNNVLLFDDKHRLAFQGCILNGEKKYIIDKQFK